jgi:tRNA-Thr(GGU) m(6)t(6)A37 methyltransferase TsaA
MAIQFEPIGTVHTDAERVPRHWTVSDLEGTLEIDPRYEEGLRDIGPGRRILVLFHFHKGKPFTPDHLVQQPPVHRQDRGVFSTCSPVRPNLIGHSIVDVLSREGHLIRVKGIDMLDGTPILDIKPYTEKRVDQGPEPA